ncbi:MAG: hypothetical protein V4691_04390 [Pseudomonadota bacterium]
MKYFVIALSSLVLCSCASAPSGGRETVRFVSNPEGATMTASNGVTCVTPCTAQIRRDEDFTAVFTKEGFATIDVPVHTQSMDERKSYSLGPLNVGYETSSVVADPTGIYNKEHTPNPVMAEMTPLAADKPRK